VRRHILLGVVKSQVGCGVFGTSCCGMKCRAPLLAKPRRRACAGARPLPMQRPDPARLLPTLPPPSPTALPPLQVKATFDFRPGMIGKALDLKRGGDR
jgi:hypothetical protein